MHNLIYTFSGFDIGLLVGLTGVGGGALMTPLLVMLFGFHPLTAVGTDLLFAASTKGVGVWVHGNQGSVDWQVVRLLSMGSLPAATVTLWLMWHFPAGDVMGHFIMSMLGITLILTSVAMLWKNKLHSIGKEQRTHKPHRFKKWQPILTVFTGVALGVLVTMTSIGAGALGAVMLTYLYPFRLSAVKLVGTDLAHAIPLTLVAGSGHILMGHVDFDLLGWLLLGSIPGIYLGSKISVRMDERHVRRGIALILMVVGIRAIT